MSKNEIKLIQLPIIQHKLQEVGKSVSKRIEELEIDKQIATVETVKSLKVLRADLNKELFDFEEQRKFIKEGVNNPYLDFENIYKSEISEKYKSAIDLLKDKIAFVENKIKSDKKESIETYFKELCVAEKIDFILFDKLGIDINLTTTEKKYKEQVSAYIAKVIDDLNLIKTTDFEAEILTEYKASLNVSNAITTVKTRKDNEAKEKARLKAEQTQNRKNHLTALGMNYVEITNAYEFNADIYITTQDIENLSQEDFTAKQSECEVKIKNHKAKELEALQQSEPLKPETKPSTNGSAVLSRPSPISAPIVEKERESEPIKTASFEVKATMSKLRLLGQFMKDNGIIYKNI